MQNSLTDSTAQPVKNETVTKKHTSMAEKLAAYRRAHSETKPDDVGGLPHETRIVTTIKPATETQVTFEGLKKPLPIIDTEKLEIIVPEEFASNPDARAIKTDFALLRAALGDADTLATQLRRTMANMRQHPELYAVVSDDDFDTVAEAVSIVAQRARMKVVERKTKASARQTDISAMTKVLEDFGVLGDLNGGVTTDDDIVSAIGNLQV